MRSLIPPAADVDIYTAYRPPLDRPWLRVSMVASLDGRVTGADGVSGSIGGEADSLAFAAMRANADLILVGAGTARAEGYGPASVRERFRTARAEDGRAGAPTMAVVSRSLELHPTGPLFSDGSAPIIVVTTAAADADRAERLAATGAAILRAGEQDVDLALAIDRLRVEHGAQSILCEGGPSINGQVFTDGLADELCLTVAPTLLGGEDDRRIVDGLSARLELSLANLLEHDGDLLARYHVGVPPRSEQAELV